jgi:Transposase DDE domain
MPTPFTKWPRWSASDLQRRVFAAHRALTHPVATLPIWDMHDWLRAWLALALSCGLPLGKDGSPRIPCPSQQCKRGQQAAAPLPEALFVLSVLVAIRTRLIGARDLIIDSAPILAWRRADPDAAYGHAPAQHPRPLLRGYRVHTLICRGSGLPLFFLLSPANVHDAPFAQPLLAWAVICIRSVHALFA